VSAGMPDVYFLWDGLPLWIELKAIKANKSNLSPQQVAWHTAHTHAGGLSFILVKHLGQGCLFLFEGREARSVASEGVLYAQGQRFEDLGSMFCGLRAVAIDHYSAVLRPAALVESPSEEGPGLS
jgi:hypothetical protein